MTAKKNSNRMDKINEELKKELSLIIDNNLKNPHITGMISVTKVKTSPDLRYARVYISLLNCKNVKETLDGLKSASGFMRSEVARRINLRYTPELRFEIDDSMEYGARIENILKEIIPNKESE
jgi:ribosome-binding factor A